VIARNDLEWILAVELSAELEKKAEKFGIDDINIAGAEIPHHVHFRERVDELAPLSLVFDSYGWRRPDKEKAARGFGLRSEE
jgi:hypothetical protein